MQEVGSSLTREIFSIIMQLTCMDSSGANRRVYQIYSLKMQAGGRGGG